MPSPIHRTALAASSCIIVAQQRLTLTPEQVATRWRLEKELQSIAIVERKVMMPMRDGIRLATDIYRPKGMSERAPDGRKDELP